MEGLQKIIKHLAVLTALLFVAQVIAPSPTYAAEKKKGSSKAKKKKSKKSSDDPSSDEAMLEKTKEGQDHKKFEILANLGMVPSPFLGFGLTAGMFLKPDLALEGSFMMSSGKVEPVAFSSTMITARVRKSFGFPYVAVGGGLRTLTAKWNTLSVDETEEFASGASGNAVILDTAVGGQFKLGSILIGADAVGIMYPLFKMGVTETKPDGKLSEDDYAAQKGKFDKQNGMGLVLFRAGIGFAF